MSLPGVHRRIELAGGEENVKEHTLGRAVFDRNGDYDPRLDPIVRVEARRLRTKLEAYYRGPGRDESIRLEYPKGSYVPEIRRAVEAKAPVSSPAPAVLLWPRLIAIIVSAVSLVFIGYEIRALPSASLTAVVPNQWISVDQTDLDPAALPISESLTAILANARLARVVAWPIVAAQHRSDGSLRGLASRIGARRVIIVVARPDGALKNVSVFVVDSASGEKLRAERYLLPVRTTADADRLASRISSDLERSGSLR